MIFKYNRYFTSGKHVSAMGVDVFGCGHFSITGKMLTPRRRVLDCFGITCLEKGQGFLETDSVHRTILKPGDLFFLFPGEGHCFGPGRDDYWQEYWLLFDGDTVRHLLKENHISPDRTLYRLGREHAVFSCLHRAIKHSETDRNGLPADVLQILGMIGSRQIPAEGSPVSAILAAVREHPEQAYDFEEMSAEHGISYSLFRRDCVRQTGLPPRQYLIRERVRRAQGFLAHGLSVAEAGRHAGIEDQYYFSRMFKKMTGMSPSAFKNSLKSWKEGH